MPTYRITTSIDKDTVKRAIDALADGKRFDVTIKRHTERRSISQNSLYHLWIGCIHRDTGSDHDEIHDVLRGMFLGHETREILGLSVDRLRSTTNLTTAEFAAYLDKIQAFAASELGITLPDPEDKHWADFYEEYGS